MLRSRCSVVENCCHHVKHGKGAATITTFTWGDVIGVITSVFEITQTRLAQMMYCNKAKITKIKEGKETPTLGIEEIFASIFDPANPKSAAKSLGKTEYCLSVLKEIIKSDFKEIFEAMADCWDEKGYKTFVLALLGRARQGAPSKQQKGVSLDETPSAQMTKLFEKAVADYNMPPIYVGCPIT